MATITSQRSGNWLRDAVNADSPWYGGEIASGVPTTADDVRIGEFYRACTITTASPAVITLNSHGYSNDDPVSFGTSHNTSGRVPLPLQGGVTYYVVVVNANSFQVSTTPGGGNLVGTTQSATTLYVSKGCHTITFDGAAVCNTLTTYPGTTLKPSASVDSSLTAQRDIIFIAGTNLDFDLSAAATPRFEMRINALANGTNNYSAWANQGMGKLKFKGWSRKRWTTLNGAITGQSAVSAAVDDATGWQIGDLIVFGTTQAYDGTSRSNTSNATYAAGELTIPLTTTSPFVPGCHVALSGFTSTNNLNTDWVVSSVTANTNIKIAGADPGASFTDAQGTVTLMPKTDKVALTGITFDNAPTNTGPATVTWSGAIAWDHADGCIIGNYSSNIELRSDTISLQAHNKLGSGFNIVTRAAQSPVNSYLIDNVLLNGLCYETYNMGALSFPNSAGAGSRDTWEGINNCAFYNTAGYDFNIGYTDYISKYPADSNVFYSEFPGTNYRALNVWTTFLNTAPWNNFHIQRSRSGYGSGSAFCEFNDWTVSGCTYSGMTGAFTGVQPFTRLKLFACATALGLPSVGEQTFKNCEIGTTFGARNQYAFGTQANGKLIMDRSSIQATAMWPESLVTYGGADSMLFLKSRGSDPNVQEYYTHNGQLTRDVSGSPPAQNGDGLMKFEPKLLAVDDMAYVSTVTVGANTTATILGNARRTSATMAVSVTASYDGITTGTPYTLNSGAVDTWFPFSLSITNSDSVPKDYTLTYSAIDTASTTAKAYIDGIPETPFINKVRWYGYLYDEASKTRTVNAAITEATEATAYAYTGIAVGTGTAPALTGVTLSANHSFVEIYDYTQAWARANIAHNVPITASVAGMLTAQCNLTATAAALSGAGSILMGSYTLAATDYTYTGGTFSQLASTPAFSGGTVSIAAEGTYDYTLSSCGVEFGEAGTAWDLSDAAISGTIAFTTSTGSLAVTVAVPTGTSYTVEGSNITVTAPIVSADISITGMVNTGGANNRLQIINQSAITAPDWQSTHVYSAGDLVLRTSGIGNENTAGLYMRCTSGGTSSGSEPTWDTTVGNTTTDGTVTWTTYSVLYYDADPASTSLTDTYIDGEEFLAGETIEIRFAEEDPGVSFKTYSTSVVATTDGFSALVNEESDDVYAIYALSGAAYETTFSPNYVANYIVLDANTDFSGKAAYAYYCYLLTTSQGMYLFWGGLTGIDPGNIRNNVDTISLYFDESGGFVKQTDDVRIFRSDSTRPAIDPTTGGSGIEINWRTPVSVVSTGGSALTSEEHNALLALPTATDVWNNSKALTVPKFLGLK